MANFEDFPPIFCITADFLPRGGGLSLCKIFTRDLHILRFFYLPAGAFDCNKVRSSQSGLVSPGL